MTLTLTSGQSLHHHHGFSWTVKVVLYLHWHSKFSTTCKKKHHSAVKSLLSGLCGVCFLSHCHLTAWVCPCTHSVRQGSVILGLSRLCQGGHRVARLAQKDSGASGNYNPRNIMQQSASSQGVPASLSDSYFPLAPSRKIETVYEKRKEGGKCHLLSVTPPVSVPAPVPRNTNI